MRAVRRASRFKKQFRKILKSPDHFDLEFRINVVLDLLLSDTALPHRFHDHSLIGNRIGFRECHIKPDLLLVYRKVGEDLLYLEEIGSHSELGF